MKLNDVLMLLNYYILIIYHGNYLIINNINRLIAAPLIIIILLLLLLRYMPDSSFTGNNSLSRNNSMNQLAQSGDKGRVAAEHSSMNDTTTDSAVSSGAGPAGTISDNLTGSPSFVKSPSFNGIKTPSSPYYPSEEHSSISYVHQTIAKRNMDYIFSDAGASILSSSSGDAVEGNNSSPQLNKEKRVAIHPESWRALFAVEDGRKYFLQMLDEKRGRYSLLNPRGFKALTTAMQVELLVFAYFSYYFSCLIIISLCRCFWMNVNL